MRRLSTFILGMVAGGAILFVLLHYHLVSATSGWHLVPKLNPTLAGTYVDIRTFGPGDWRGTPTWRWPC